MNNKDMVNHPSHYMSETGLETIDVIEAFTFDLNGIEAFDTANILKYICRWKSKNGLEDLKKAQWYLNHLIEHVDKLEKENVEANVENTRYYFSTRSEACYILRCMKDIIKKYGFVTMLDLHDLIGMVGVYQESLYGWIDLKKVEIKRNERVGYLEDNSYMLVLPMPVPIKSIKTEKEND